MRITFERFTRSFWLMAAAAIAACGGGTEPNATPPTPSIKANVPAPVMKAAAVTGGSAVAIHMYQALYGMAPSNATLSTHTVQATADPAAFARTLTNNFASTSSTALAKLVLDNLNVTAATVTAVNTQGQSEYAILLDALGQMFTFYGADARGQIILNATNLLAGLETDATYGVTAAAYNNQASANFNYSSDPANTVSVTPATPRGTSFTIPATASSLIVAINSFTGTDNLGVAGYYVSESASTPSSTASAWSSSKPTNYTFNFGGNRTLYAWIKNTAGRISAPLSAAVAITLPVDVGAAGAVDTTFATSGKLISSYGGQSMFGPAVKIQPDGKLVIVGKDFNGNDDDFLVQRFFSTGSPDTTFGTNGATVIKLSSKDDNAKGLAFQSDGKIIIAGGAGQASSYETSVLVRVTTDGILDTSFGTGGKVLIDFGLPSHSHSVAVQSDGNIVVTGETYTTADGGLFATARVLPNGAFDTSFGTGGKVTQTLGSGANAHALVLQADGRILLGGYAALTDTGKAGFIVSRLLSNGTPDASFGTNGYSTASVGTGNNYCHALMLQSDGKIILAGSAGTAPNYDFTLLRFNTNGVLDTSFGSGGIVTTNFVTGTHPSAEETAGGVIQADGKIIVGGYSDRKFALARYLSSGALDSSFGTGGMVTTVVGTDNNDWIKSLALQPWDGKIVAVGYSKNGSTFNLAVVRYLSSSL